MTPNLIVIFALAALADGLLFMLVAVMDWSEDDRCGMKR